MLHIIRDSKLKALIQRSYLDGVVYGVRVGHSMGMAAQREMGCVLEGYDAVREAERILKENGNAKRD